MDKIDTRAVDTVAPGRLVHLAGVREHSWQHALERAFIAQGGGHAAAAGPAVPNEQPIPPATHGEATAHMLQSLKGADAHRSAIHVDDAAAVQPVNGSPGAPREGSGPAAYRAWGLRAGDAVDGAETLPLGEATPQVRLAWSAYARLAAPASAGQVPASEAVPGAPVESDRAGHEVSEQQVFLERTAQGAVIWIRDAQASPAQLRVLVNALLQQSKNSGVPVCGVRINGLPVDVDSPADGTPSLDTEAVVPNGSLALSRRHTHGH